MKLGDLSDVQLLDSLKALCGHGRVLLARLLAHLVEVEERRLHLEAACPSMFQFCVQRLGMSEDEACRRIQAARLARRFPDLLARIERGELTLATIALLGDALSESSYAELVEAAAGKTKAEVRALLARRSPRPDVPAAITTIPMQSSIAVPGAERGAARAAFAGPQLAPLSEARHRVQFTASDALRKKLERAQDLMRHANADGDLAIVIDRALDLLLAKLEKQRLGKTSRVRRLPAESGPASSQGPAPAPPVPQASSASPAPSASPASRASPASPASPPARVPRATRRAVFERDGERCTFTDAHGRRCTATTWLELDHVVARGCGGGSELENLRVRCRAHNLLHAEQTFGRDLVERRIRERHCPRQRGSVSTTHESISATHEMAASGLVIMGFRRADVRRALDAVRARHSSDAPSTMPLQTIIREALAVLGTDCPSLEDSSRSR